MLIKITSNNNIDTYVYERYEGVARNMARYFNQLGLSVEFVDAHEPLSNGKQFDTVKNNERCLWLKKEYKEFGNQAPQLRLVK